MLCPLVFGDLKGAAAGVVGVLRVHEAWARAPRFGLEAVVAPVRLAAAGPEHRVRARREQH